MMFWQLVRDIEVNSEYYLLREIRKKFKLSTKWKQKIITNIVILI